MFNKNIEHLKYTLEKFDKFVYFSFPSITTYLNKQNKEKKKPIFNDIKWKNIKEKTINFSHNAFAIICGKISNLTVIDIDCVDIYKQLIEKYKILKNVFKIESRNGVHLYFNYNKDIKTTTNAFVSYQNIDIRNDDSIIFIPPTNYKLLNGNIYEYVFIGGDLIDIPVELFTEFKQFNIDITINKINNNNNNNNNIVINNDFKNIHKKKEIENLIFQLPKNYYDDYNEWLKIGFIIFNELGLNGFDLFNIWSEQSDKYDFNEDKKKFYSFKYNSDGLTVATLYKILHDTKNKNYNILLNFTTGDNADYFKNKYDNKFIFSNGVLYYFNDVYYKADDNNFSYLNNFINDKYFYDIFKLFQQYEIEELKKKDIDKKDICVNIEKIKKKILNLKNHKLRKNYISDIICKITNNDIKWNQKTNLFAF